MRSSRLGKSPDVPCLHLSSVRNSDGRLVADALEPNMESFRNILVDIDATAIAHPALERAILLAKRSLGTTSSHSAGAVTDQRHASDWR
jgi:hypothetical protein